MNRNLTAARILLAAASRSETCLFMRHEQRLEEDRAAWVTLARVRDEVARWGLNTLEPQTMRALGDIIRALNEPVPAPETTGHIYLSTSCFHGDHDYCKSMTGLNGAKRPGECKHCGARCTCGCHAKPATAGTEATDATKE